jgi:hypothetical protein
MSTDNATLGPVEEALEDAHHFLHACERSYHDPPAFRRNLNSFIQAARNVTFRLQSLKALIPEFGAWYSAWQVYLRSHSLMRWVNSARTEVVKRRGLATRSTARYSVTYSYEQPIHETIEVPAETPTAEILHQAVGRVPFTVRDRVLVTIEREWVAQNLPGRELLGTMGECLAVLAALLSEAKKARSSGPVMATPGDAVRSLARPECLSSLDQARVVRVHPGTGEFYVYGQQPIPGLSDEEGEARVAKYGWPSGSMRLRTHWRRPKGSLSLVAGPFRLMATT